MTTVCPHLVDEPDVLVVEKHPDNGVARAVPQSG
jgi:hypothetical protein